MSKQGVAVRLCARGDLCADLAGGASLGLDDDRLLEQRLEHRRKRTCDYIDRAAGRKRVDDGNRMRRIGILCRCRPHAESRGSRGAAGDEMTSVHVILPGKRCFAGI